MKYILKFDAQSAEAVDLEDGRGKNFYGCHFIYPPFDTPVEAEAVRDHEVKRCGRVGVLITSQIVGVD